MSLSNFYCVDCGTNTHEIAGNGHYYMVYNHLWKKFGAGKQMLCLDCLQQRVGRLLTRADFTDFPINNRFNTVLTKWLEENAG